LNPEQLGDILSSEVRLKMADALSQRPRTLQELAHLTGISVQGVLRHLRLLEKMGLVEARKVGLKAPKARKLYAAKGEVVEDYSSGRLTVVKAIERWAPPDRTPKAGGDPEGIAAEVFIRRRRVRDEIKKLGRLIDEVAESREELDAVLGSLPLSVEERLILEVILTEETVEDGIRVLSRYYGIEDRRSIDKALAKAKRNVSR